MHRMHIRCRMMYAFFKLTLPFYKPILAASQRFAWAFSTPPRGALVIPCNYSCGVELRSCGAVELWSCGHVDTWSCGHMAVELWSCRAVELWQSNDEVLFVFFDDLKFILQ